MQTWEYTLLRLSGSDQNAQQDALNEFGDDGWELVAIHPETDFANPLAYLKRPKQDRANADR